MIFSMHCHGDSTTKNKKQQPKKPISNRKGENSGMQITIKGESLK